MSNIGKIDPKLKEKWVKALKSGKYIQTQGSLKEEDVHGTASYCCLGVLAQVYPGRTRWRVSPESKFYDMGTKRYYPKDIGHLGGTSLEHRILDDGIQSKLIDMNDSGNWDFEEIAEYIEENL